MLNGGGDTSPTSPSKFTSNESHLSLQNNNRNENSRSIKILQKNEMPTMMNISVIGQGENQISLVKNEKSKDTKLKLNRFHGLEE